jgi:hypothetical protein
MGRPAVSHPVTAREIILEIVRNMRDGLEPLHYSTLPPAVYHAYLHPDDVERLRGILPRIVDEARRALDAELESLNRAGLAERLRLTRRSQPLIVAPEGGWEIRILENTDDGIEPGDITIHSELALPAKNDLGAGSMTKRITTRRLAGVQSTAQSYQPQSSQPQGSQPPSHQPGNQENHAAPGAAETPAEIRKDQAPAAAEEPGTLAVIEYQDNTGRQTYRMTKDQIVVGRGGRDYWTDIKLETLPDVSREHLRLRRDPNSGKFFLKDLSRLGTTINGETVPSSVEYADGEKRDRNQETPVPPQSRIGLAGVVFLEFRSTSQG